MEYNVTHRTTYRYAQSVLNSCHLAHLAPRETPMQQVRKTDLVVSLATAKRHSLNDFFGNKSEWFAVEQPHTVLEVRSESQVVVSPAKKSDPGESLAWEQVRTALEAAREPDIRDAVQYIFDTPLTAPPAALRAYAAQSFRPARPVLVAALDLMHRIHRDFRYDSSVTDATTPVGRVFEMRSGVCQDLAHVGIACVRSLGLAARYVSGYLRTIPPPGKPRMIGADASHAWFSVWAPPFGWIDLDPTNDIPVGEGHITVAWGRDYSDVAPLIGIVTGGGDHIVEVGVDVAPVEEE